MSGCFFMRVVSRQGGPFSAWLPIIVVSHHGLSSGWSLIRVLAQAGLLLG